MNRRNFLIASSASWLTISNSNVSFGITKENIPNYNPNQNSAIYLFLSGGPSHIELFNTIPNSTSDRKSVTGTLKTNILGMEIGGSLHNLYSSAD